MNYHEALDAEVTAAEAKAEIKKHDASWHDFIREYGDRNEYMGKEVLDFLGY
jgi:archaellum biogenesis protein FlaJ (TadC family)